MFLLKKNSNWKRLSDTNPKRVFRGLNFDSLFILDSVWNKELGNLSGHCSLAAVKNDCVVVKTDSSVVSNELMIRSPAIVRNLNKYFRKPWIKRIRISHRI